ncbi:hypothetical protein Fmac_006157 [Flemingia macrophylla]|uniref:non-specific serine/threonine protein kinase n=1 Tax=Flemingia macrophylla TaxID=520843 RepID=A0ABD1N9T6_9FABA
MTLPCSGSISQELGKMKNLNILDLSNNRLEGHILQALTGFSLLTEIDFSNNFPSGLIPESEGFGIAKMPHLENGWNSYTVVTSLDK